jgi:hypothetical protein
MSTDGEPKKPAVFQDEAFILEEGILYKLASRLAIWMNKLLFSSLFLLGVWLIWASITGDAGCAETVRVVKTANGTVDQGTTENCSVFLSTTSLFLGAMAVLSFIAQLGFGILGLMLGKRIVPAAVLAREEVGARRETGDADTTQPTQDADDKQ